MKVLVNYNPEDKNFLPQLQGLMKAEGAYGISTSKTYKLGELLLLANHQDCQAILLANESTLANCVNAADGEPSLSTWRGSRLNFSTPAIVLGPLKHLKTLPYGKFLLEKDLKKLRHIREKPQQLQYIKIDDIPSMISANGHLQSAEIISIDIETDLHNRITCVSFTGLWKDLRIITYLLPFYDFTECHYQNEEDLEFALTTLQAICSNSVPKLFFNGLYDVFILLTYRAYPNNWILDAMALAYCEYSELPKTLAFVSSLYLYDYYYWKEEKDTSDLQQFWLYNCRDSYNTLRVFLHQLLEVPSYAIWNYREQFKLVYPSLYCSFEGFKIDAEAKATLRLEADAKLAVHLKNLRTMAQDPEFNPASPKQTAAFIYDILGAKPIGGKFGKDTSRSTDEKILKKIALQHPILELVIREIWDYREQQKLITTYFNALETENGRLVYSLSPFATDTARLASRQSSWRIKLNGKIRNYGAQVQNIPPLPKKFLVADEGFVIIEPDNNKSEARCVALLSGCKAMQAALENKEKDFYKQLGQLFFGLAYEKVTKDLRNLVLKRIVHGTNYMMQADTFIDHVGIKEILKGAALLGAKISPTLELNEATLEFPSVKHFATFLLETYHKPFPEVRQWYEKIKNRIAKTSKLVSPLGWTRYFFGDIEKVPAVLRSAVAHEPQNLSVQIVNRGWWKIYSQLVVNSAGEVRLKAQVHDSTPAQVLESKKEEYAEKIRNLLEQDVKIGGEILHIPVDYHFGHTWFEAKEG